MHRGFERYMHVACIVTKIEVIFQIRGKIRGLKIASLQNLLKDFVDNSDLVAMCIIRIMQKIKDPKGSRRHFNQ